MKRALVAITALVALAILVWIGGEFHYRNCVDAAKAAYPPSLERSFIGGTVDVNAGHRRRRIAGCSRLPF